MIDLSAIVIRKADPADYHRVTSVMPEWWNGRDLSSAALKIFFIHFHETTFIAEIDKSLVGFLIGFFSQSRREEGYIHFAGVHPEYRNIGLGRKLYENFFEVCRADSRTVIRSCTSPINKLSINFHQHMGFIIEQGDAVIDSVSVTTNYLYNGEPKVLFVKNISR